MGCTWPIAVALAEGDIAEAHSAVADDDKARQAGELGVLYGHVARQSFKAQDQPIICNDHSRQVSQSCTASTSCSQPWGCMFAHTAGSCSSCSRMCQSQL